MIPVVQVSFQESYPVGLLHARTKTKNDLVVLHTNDVPPKALFIPFHPFSPFVLLVASHFSCGFEAIELLKLSGWSPREVRLSA